MNVLSFFFVFRSSDRNIQQHFPSRIINTAIHILFRLKNQSFFYRVAACMSFCFWFGCFIFFLALTTNARINIRASGWNSPKNFSTIISKIPTTDNSLKVKTRHLPVIESSSTPAGVLFNPGFSADLSAAAVAISAALLHPN